MAKPYKCPACKNEVDGGAAICSNPTCRRELAFCSHCRDVATFTRIEASRGRFARDRVRCDLCERLGARCLSSAAGGYCNGLARADSWGRPLCARCTERAWELGRTVAGSMLIAALGGLLRRR